MGVLYGFLILVEILVCALLIVIIFMQKSKGGMGGSAFGGGAGEAIFGSRMGNVLTKSTVVLGIVFLLNTLVLTVLTTQRSGFGGSVMEGPAGRTPSGAQQPGMPGPGAEAADWMDMELQPAGDMALPVEIPLRAEDIEAEEAIQIAPTAGMDIPAVVPEAVDGAEPVVVPDYDVEPSAVPEGTDPDLGE